MKNCVKQQKFKNLKKNLKLVGNNEIHSNN